MPRKSFYPFHKMDDKELFTEYIDVMSQRHFTQEEKELHWIDVLEEQRPRVFAAGKEAMSDFTRKLNERFYYKIRT